MSNLVLSGITSAITGGLLGTLPGVTDGGLLGNLFGDISGSFGNLFGGPTDALLQGIDDIGQLGYGGSLGSLGGTSLGNTIAQVSDLLSIPTSALKSGGLSALNAAFKGGNPLTAGFTSGLSSIFGGGIADATGSNALGRLAGSASNFGLNSLFNSRGETPGQSSIDQFLATVPNQAMQQQMPPQQSYEQPNMSEEDMRKYRNYVFSVKNAQRMRDQLNG